MIQTKKPTIVLAMALISTLLSTAVYAFAIDGVFSSNSQAGANLFGFVSVESNDPPGSIDPGAKYDIAWTEAELLNAGGDDAANSLSVSIGNAYPSYNTKIEAVIINNRSVPVKISSVNLEYSPSLTIGMPEIEGIVLAPGESKNADIDILINDNAEENDTCNFSLDITGADATSGD